MNLPFAFECLRFLLKAALGTVLFTLILWCAQSRRPRAAGMMLTFPALNGIGLLTAERASLFPMAQAMPPMIAFNGLLCAAYVLLQRCLAAHVSGVPPLVQHLGVLGMCLLLWGGFAMWIAPGLERALVSFRQILAFVGVYAGCSLPLIALVFWCPTSTQKSVRLSFWQTLQAHAVRVIGMFVCIGLVMLAAHRGEDAWAGRLSALPILPFYSLLALSVMPDAAPPGPSHLQQLGSTVLCGPLVAIAFVWALAHALHALRAEESATATVLAVGALLGLWGLCGFLIWGVLWLAQRLET